MENTEKTNNTGDKSRVNKLSEYIHISHKLLLPRASVPGNQGRPVRKKLLTEVVIFLVIAAVAVVMLLIPEINNHEFTGISAWDNLDWYIFIIVILVFIDITFLVLIFPRTIAEIPSKEERKQKEEAELIRNKNYVRHLHRLIDDYKNGLSEVMTSNFVSVSQVLDSVNMDFGDYLKKYISANALMVRLGLEDVDISDYIELDAPAERVEKPEELLWLAREVVKKYSVINDMPAVINLGNEKTIGIVGDKKAAYDIARMIIGQLEMLGTKDQVALAFCYNAQTDGEIWAGYDKLALANGDLFAGNETEARDVMDRLVAKLEKQESSEGRHIFLFVSDPGLVAGHEIERYIQNDEQKQVITVVVLADDEKKLPHGIDKVIVSETDFTGIHSLETGDMRYIRFDEVTQDMLLKVDEFMN